MTASVRVPSLKQFRQDITCSNLSLERPAISKRARRLAKKKVRKVKREG